MRNVALPIPDDASDAHLLTVSEVGVMLRVHAKRVYSLPIPQVRLSPRRIRWKLADVRAFVSAQRAA